MIETLGQLKQERPDLVEFFESLSHEKLLDQIYLEVLDALNMESRVEVFMSECTINMSKTNYTLESLRSLISAKKDRDLKEFCQDLLENLPTPDELYIEISQKAKE